MTYSHPLAKRERALEDAFFRKETERQLEKMRQDSSHEAQSEALSKALGIQDAAVLDSLLELGVRDSNVTAVILAPLICVAWADGMMDNEEHRIIVRSEVALGVEPESEGAKLVDVWLRHRPHESLIDAWSGYVRELCTELGTEARDRLRDDIVSRARRVARAVEKSFLRGGGPTKEEAAILEKIEAAFESAPAE